MSRHSKNNTAGSVFTYGERKMLKDYGTLKQRVGQESQKSFEICALCLHKVVDPMVCKEGHIFCKDCIIENLAIQKKNREEEVGRWEQHQKNIEEKKVEEEETALLKKIENFEKSELEYRIGVKTKKQDTSEDKEQLKQLISTNNSDQYKDKIDMIKKNFWVPETHKPLVELAKDKPSTKLTCPASEKGHHIRMKELYKAQICEVGSVLACHVCRKELKFQKIVMSSVCGHVFCKKCSELDAASKKKEEKKKTQCPVCGKMYKKEQLVQMQESLSSYSSHNNVEVHKYSSAFAV